MEPQPHFLSSISPHKLSFKLVQADNRRNNRNASRLQRSKTGSAERIKTKGGKRKKSKKSKGGQDGDSMEIIDELEQSGYILAISQKEHLEKSSRSPPAPK